MLFVEQFPDIPHDETDVAVEQNTTFHSADIWAARLLAPSVNNTAMLLMWDLPRRDLLHHPKINNTLCAFRLHYYRAGGAAASHPQTNSVSL